MEVLTRANVRCLAVARVPTFVMLTLNAVLGKRLRNEPREMNISTNIEHENKLKI